MAESGVMGMVSAFIGVAILLAIGIQILGNSVQDCTNIADYRSPKSVTAVTITNAGASYETAPAVTFGAAPTGGITATGTTTITAGKTVASVVIDEPGAGYVTAPSVTISGGGGANATATATIGTSTTGWAAACASANSQSQAAYALLIIILILLVRS